MIKFELEPLEIHDEVVAPQGCTFTHSGQLGGLEVGEAQCGKVGVVRRECPEVVNHGHQPITDREHGFAQDDQIGIVDNKGAGCSKMDNGSGQRGGIAECVDMRHDVVAQVFLVARRRLEVDVGGHAFHLSDLPRGDFEPKFALGLGQSNPQTPPGQNSLLRPKEFGHVPRRIAGDQW